MTFMEMLTESTLKNPDHIMLADDTVPKGMSFRQIDAITGKIYSYLSQKGLGKEDFVMICLPRGVKPIISMYGILRAGCAFVLVEDNYAPQRIEFIKNDCGCKIVLDEKVWEDIQECEYKEGYAQTDEHDAAFAVYTSGTTGNPKGVLHEYGNIDRMVQSVTMTTCEPLATEEDRFALVAPLNFVASTLIIFAGIKYKTFLYVVPYKTLKNPMLIGMFLMMNKITGTFLTPSHIRKIGNKLPGLRFCIIGSEPANEVYAEGLKIHNFYLMSESGFAVAHFLIDKLYQETPVGGSEFGHEILLLDESGNPVADGEEGEICFENKYVRGYLNLPDQTKEVFRDGLYHTGDLAKKDEKGRLIICGRLSDMAKVNGNRVEPGEIEIVAKKVMGVDWTAARIFENRNNVFIALYYKDKKVKIDEEKVRAEMEKYLPYYMIPSFFMLIDEVPLRPNGKMDRKALPKPNFEDYKSDYAAPENEIQKTLCEAFQEVLKMDQIGIDDDFYQLGGDSLASMDVIEKCNLPGFTATQIFRGHTPRKISEIYEKEGAGALNENIDEANKNALSNPQPLSAEQLYMMDYQLYTPKSTMYNLYSMLKFDTEIIDMQKIADSVKKAVFNHPAILTTFSFNEDGEPQQKYTPEIWKDIEVEEISEFDLDTLKDTLVRPFKMTNSALYRCRIFKTEKAGYLFFDIHHTLFDGTSSKVFFGDVLKASFDQPLDPDYYYYNISKRRKLTESDFYIESQKYFKDRYDNAGVDWEKHPKVDNETRENRNDEIFYSLPINKESYDLNLKINNLSPNAFFITANLLSTAFYNKHRDIMLSWIYNGRNDMSEMSTVGLMFRNLPVGVQLSAGMKLQDLYRDVVDQINKGIEHSCYSAVENNSSVVSDDMACVLYQDDLREMGEMPGLLGEVEIETQFAASQNVLDLEILNTPEGMQVMLDYASSRYDAASIERYRDLMGIVINSMIKHAGDSDTTIKTILSDVYDELHVRVLFRKKDLYGWLTGSKRRK